jgi:hypothetical protein
MVLILKTVFDLSRFRFRMAECGSKDRKSQIATVMTDLVSQLMVTSVEGGLSEN